MSVLESARDFVRRAVAVGQSGRAATAEEVEAVRAAHGGRFPRWLADLGQQLPLCGLRLGWRSDAFKPWEGPWWLVWPTPAELVRELEHSVLSGAALGAGLVLLALDGSDSGNPYFVPLEGDDPPVYRLYHDGSELDPTDRTLVAESLSAFLRVAEVRPLTDEEAEALMFADPEPDAS
jgi:hypothetical protein